MKKNTKKGFTIVELVIVIAVIAILSAVLIPTFSSVVKKAEESAALQEATSAVTILLSEEDGQLDEEAKYYILYTNEDGDVAWFTLEDNKKVKAIDEQSVTPGTEDTVWYKKGITKPTFAGSSATTDENEDISAKIIIFKDVA